MGDEVGDIRGRSIGRERGSSGCRGDPRTRDAPISLIPYDSNIARYADTWLVWQYGCVSSNGAMYDEEKLGDIVC